MYSYFTVYQFYLLKISGLVDTIWEKKVLRLHRISPYDGGKLKTKRKKKGIPPRRNREVEKYEQKVSVDLEEEQIVLAPSSIFDVNQYLK